MSGPSRRSHLNWRRITAAVALAAAAWVFVLGVIVAVDDFPRGLLLLLCAALVAAGAWEGVLRRGWGRVAGLAVSGVALAGGVLVLGDEGYLLSLVLLGVGALIWHAAARAAFRPTSFCLQRRDRSGPLSSSIPLRWRPGGPGRSGGCGRGTGHRGGGAARR